MDSLKLPTTAAQAKVYTDSKSLMFPGGLDNEGKSMAQNGVSADGRDYDVTGNLVKTEARNGDVVEPKQERQRYIVRNRANASKYCGDR